MSGVMGTALAAALMLVPGVAWGQASPSDYTYATRYDAARRVVGTIAPDPDGAGPLHYMAVRNTYDAAGRLTRQEKGQLATWQSETTAPASWGSAFNIYNQVDTEYDAMDRKTVERTSSGGTTYAATQYSYDSLGRLECTALRMNPAIYTSLPASACTLGTEGSFGPDRIIRNSYDAAGQLLKVQQAYATPLQQDYATYTYSANGKQLSVKDANGNLASMTYDGFDRQSQWNFPSPTSVGTVSSTDYEAYGYDANGNRTSFKKRDGRTFTYNYDNLNRVISKIVPDGCASIQVGGCAPASATRDVYYGYDLRGLQTYARFDSASGEGIATGYTGFGEVAASTNTMGGTSRTLSFTYDADGSRTRVTHPDGQFVNYAREGLDRVYFTGDSTGRPLFYPPYDEQGRVATLYRLVSSTAYWGAPTVYGYDPVSRLSSMSTTLTNGNANVTSTFAYNPASQMTSQTRDNDAYAFTGYVNVNRTYGVNGLNQYTSAGPATFTYDANGNLVSDGSNTNVFDAENRLTSVSGGHDATLTYDPLGRLFSTHSATTGTTQFLYDGDQLTAEYDGAGNMLNRYVHSDGEDDPLVWYTGADLSSPRFLYTDHQGSIVAVTDANGAPIRVNAYDEYGIPNATNLGRFQYTGQAWIPELGMYYYKARIYSPTLGRFLQTDPIGYKDQINLYAYVANDPVNGRDPSGKDTVVELRYYILGSAPIQGDYGHQYVYMRDTKTGETVISRAGPSEPISTLAGVSNSTSTAKNGGPVTIQTTMTPASESVDAGRQARVVSGSQTVLKEDIGAAKGQMQKFNNAVDGAKIPYQAQSQNSNSYAGSAYGALTGKTAPTRDVLPGSGNDLRPQIPQCQGASKPCGGN